MNKIVLSLLMATVSTCAIADLMLIFRYSDADVHADPSTISRVKDKSAMWTVSDSRKDKDFLGAMYRSVRTRMEYDCARMTSLHVKSKSGLTSTGGYPGHIVPCQS